MKVITAKPLILYYIILHYIISIFYYIISESVRSGGHRGPPRSRLYHHMLCYVMEADIMSYHILSGSGGYDLCCRLLVIFFSLWCVVQGTKTTRGRPSFLIALGTIFIFAFLSAF